MRVFRTSNPALNEKQFNSARNYGVGETMTVQGTINKTFVLLFLAFIPALWVWGMVGTSTAPVLETAYGTEQSSGIPPMVGGLMMLGVIGGLISALVTIFKKEWAMITAPMYAVFEGLMLGGISAIYEMQYQGIVFQAVALTVATMFCMLTAYRSGMIKVTDKFRMGIVAATGAICLVYMVSWIMSFFGGSIPLIHSSGMFGIGFSLIVVGIAALNLVLDFDFIDRASKMSVPKYMEWYGAFGLMVTLIWLYIEILRLLAKLRSRR